MVDRSGNTEPLGPESCTTADKIAIELTVNGHSVQVRIEPMERLITTLRERLKLKGAKEGCGEGQCGTCTVLLDGQAINSCLMLTYQTRGREVTTIEGLSRDSLLDPLQQSFIDHGAIQCGYCTPGMIMSAKALLLANPSPTEDEIREGLAGNLCRCTGYHGIVEAVKAASRAK